MMRQQFPTRRWGALLLFLLSFLIFNDEESVFVQYVLAKEASEPGVSSADNAARKAGEIGTTEVGAPPVVATILKDATAEESNKQKEKEYAERRSKVYSRVEFASFVLQKSPLEDEFCVYDVQKEGDEGDDEDEKIGPVPLLKKREKTEREVLPSLKAYKTSVQEQLQQKRAWEKKAKKATKSGENISSGGEQQPVVVVASNGEKDLNSSTPGEEADESTKSGISVSDDATLAEEQSASSASSSSSSSSLSSTTASSEKKASDGDEKGANEKTDIEKTEKAQVANKETASSAKTSENKGDRETETNRNEEHAGNDGIEKAADKTEHTKSAAEKSEESETSALDVNAAASSSESSTKVEAEIDKSSADEHNNVADSKENNHLDSEDSKASDANDEDDDDDDDDDDMANKIIHPQSVTKEDREKYNLASVRNGAKVISCPWYELGT